MKLIDECWAMIPARSGSKTIKNKNIKKINNKPLIYYSLKFAKDLKFFDKIIFSSDSSKYLKLASKYGRFISTKEINLPLQIKHQITKFLRISYLIM